MPLYERGSRLSVVDDLGIGLIIHLPQSEGTMPLSRHILNKTCKKETAVSFLSTSVGILSIPVALPRFAESIALVPQNTNMLIKFLLALLIRCIISHITTSVFITIA